MHNSRDDRNADGVSSTLKTLRLQDSELQVMSDEGFALSMHQPWASLLVAGIKRFVFCSRAMISLFEHVCVLLVHDMMAVFILSDDDEQNLSGSVAFTRGHCYSRIAG